MNNHNCSVEYSVGFSLAKASELYKEGKIDEAKELVLQMAQSRPDDTKTLRAVGLFLISGEYYSEFEVAANMLEKCFPDFPSDALVYNQYAYACWVIQRKEGALNGSLRAIALCPENIDTYIRLAMHYFTEGQYTEAFITLSAGIACCQDKIRIKRGYTWLKLAEILMKGIRKVQFEFGGKRFVFGISAYNGQALETDLCHAHGTFCEAEELRFLSKALGQCNTIVECGILVGNHLIYFMKMLSPRKIIGFDADSRSITEANRNVELNREDGLTTDVELHHKAVGKANGQTTFNGQTVDVVRLSEAVTEPVDFLKVDVDGMELEVIEGAYELIKRSRPKIMIEVKKQNMPAFFKEMQGLGYRVEHSFDRSDHGNIFLVPN